MERKRALGILLLVFLFSSIAFADSIKEVVFETTGGNLSSAANSKVLTLSGMAVQFEKINGHFVPPGNLSVDFTTPVADLVIFDGTNAAVHFAAGGTLQIKGPGGAVIFSGSFSSADWKQTKDATTGKFISDFVGKLQGTITIGGKTVNVSGEIRFTTVPGAQAYRSNANFNVAVDKGTVSLVTPEPATLTLFGTGLAAIAGANRRRKRRGAEMR